MGLGVLMWAQVSCTPPPPDHSFGQAKAHFLWLAPGASQPRPAPATCPQAWRHMPPIVQSTGVLAISRSTKVSLQE